VPITAQVLSGTNAGTGASVVFTLTSSSGNPTTKTITAGSTGLAVWNYKAMQRGTYSVNAKATLSSAAATSNTVIKITT
jgi:predicted secreted protein